MNLTQWLNHLETLHPNTIDLGLERVAQVAHTLELLPFACPVITVAGTNGKGSTVALLENIFLAAGYKVGAYTSPHLIHYNERTRINAQSVEDAALCAAFAAIEQARGTISLTYFEFGTLAALLIFKQLALDVVILEVGMGGRLDAVNIVDADVAVISTIAIDHTEWLGKDRETIGLEKAGIMRAYTPTVCGDFATPASVRDYAKKLPAILYCQGEDFGYETTADGWRWWGHTRQLTDLPIPAIALQNAATVLQTIALLPPALKITESAIKKALQTVRVTGRFQIIAGEVQQILDVAHNPAAGALLAQQLQTQTCSGRTLAVIAMLTDKDMAGTIEHLINTITDWHVAGLDVPRGGKADVLAGHLRMQGAQIVYEHADVATAYKTALANAQVGDRIIVFGSFYTVAEVLRLAL